MMKETINNLVGSGQTIIGLGPMSKICVDTIYNYSHQNSQPIMLIASRRQVECAALGGGYVNAWTTEQFGEYCNNLKSKFPNSKVFLCRDHGGPWQGTNEDNLTLEQAMENAIKSYEADILADFHLLHIDPSLCKDGNMSMRAVLENTIKLIRHCDKFAKEHGKDIEYEIGTEENSGTITTEDSFRQLVAGMDSLCKREGIKRPIFVVGQTMSLVREMRQVGEFNETHTPKLMALAKQYGFLLKEHNGDYLDEYQMRQRLKIGVPAMNVAPELGVFESMAFVDFCMENGKPELTDKFFELAINSGKWKKWVINPDHINRHDKALICGHYVFAKPEFKALVSQLDSSGLESTIEKKLWSRLDFYFKRYLH